MKTFIPLENNPTVMTKLAHNLGLSPDLAFQDIYSLTDLDHLPRPAYALLVIIPMTPSWAASRQAEDQHLKDYTGCGADEPVIWFKQTIRHACGLIGILHCALNLPTTASLPTPILPNSTLSQILEKSVPLQTAARAQFLYDSEALEAAHAAAAAEGDTIPPEDADDLPFHFVAFVRGRDGGLWELEGGRKGPIERGILPSGEDGDMLSVTALRKGLGRVMEMEKEGGGDLRFSAIVLGPNQE